MSEIKSKCPKCGSDMEEGFILEYKHETFGEPRTTSEWIAGKPEKETWLGTNLGVKITDRRRLKVAAFRCVTCGFLEFYAPNQPLTSK